MGAVANTLPAGTLEKGYWRSDGNSLEIQDPRHPLGFAINAAEGRGGKMKFSIERGGAKKTVVIQLDPIGSNSTTYPVGCKKSQKIVDETAEFILANGGSLTEIQSRTRRRMNHSPRICPGGRPAEYQQNE